MKLSSLFMKLDALNQNNVHRSKFRGLVIMAALSPPTCLRPVGRSVAVGHPFCLSPEKCVVVSLLDFWAGKAGLSLDFWRPKRQNFFVSRCFLYHFPPLGLELDFRVGGLPYRAPKDTNNGGGAA